MLRIVAREQADAERAAGRVKGRRKRRKQGVARTRAQTTAQGTNKQETGKMTDAPPKTLDEWLDSVNAEMEDTVTKAHTTHYILLCSTWTEYLVSFAKHYLFLFAIWATAAAFESIVLEVFALMFWALCVFTYFYRQHRRALLSRMTPRQAKAFLARHHPGD